MATLDLVSPKLKEKGADTTSAEASSNPFSLKRYSGGVRKIASFGLSLFLIGLVITALWAPSYWVVSVLCSSVYGHWLAYRLLVRRTACGDNHYFFYCFCPHQHKLRTNFGLANQDSRRRRANGNRKATPRHLLKLLDAFRKILGTLEMMCFQVRWCCTF